MHNNPNQEIRTDYAVNDVFKPINANQLAKSIHYDFVVTQDLFDAFVQYNELTEGSIVYINNLLKSKLNGSTGPNISGVKAPLNIYIAANTKGYKLEFVDHFIVGISGGYVDVSDFKEGGQFTYEKTRDMFNIYSAYPYEVASIWGGLNLWSTITSYVVIDPDTISYSQFSGVAKIGYYKLNGALTVNPVTGFQMVFGTHLGDYVPAQNPSSTTSWDTYIPTVVFANWMNGGTGEYSIVDSTTRVPGIFQSITATLTGYSCGVILNVVTGNTVKPYSLSSYSPTEIRFINNDIGRIVSIATDGSITYATMTVPMSGSVVLTDYAVGDTYGLVKYDISGCKSIIDYYNRVQVVRDGVDNFATIEEETNNHSWYAPSWGFDFKSAKVLNWYTWFALSLQVLNDETVNWVYNNRSSLYINSDSLRDGVIYEVNIHVMKLPLNPYRPDNKSSRGQALNQAIPNTSPTDPTGFDTTKYIELFFYNSSGSATYTTVWGGDNNMSYVLRTTWVKTDSNPSTLTSGNPSNVIPLSELAYSTTRFVKLDGKIYVMAY